MSTKLDRFLMSIDPDITVKETSARADRAVNSFRARSAVIRSWEDFRTTMVRFCSHVEKIVLRLPVDRPPDLNMHWGMCNRLLKKEYGPSWDKAAFEMVRTGSQGGLYAVLKALARRMVEEYSTREVFAKITQFWNSLSVDEKLAVSKEYVQKYGHLLPSELAEGSGARVRANFPKVLEQHPLLIQRLRGIGRTT